MKKGQEIELTVTKLAFGGKGIARVDDRVIFIQGGLPGDKVRTKVGKVKKNHAEAYLVEVLQESPFRQKALCNHFVHCGGCKWQNLIYQKQIEFKREQLIESIKHIAGIEPHTVYPTIPSPLTFGYRNKMEFSFTDNRWLTPVELLNPELKKGYALGMHVPGSFDRIMHIQHCWLQDEEMNKILTFCQEYFKQSGLIVFNLKSHEGLLRFVVIRKSFAYQNYMVNIVTFRKAINNLKKFATSISREIPKISGIINTVNPKYAQIAFGEEEHLLYGKRNLLEKLGNYEFIISANSFFQTNPLQAHNLFKIVQRYAGENNTLILDLYSGTGSIAMFLSQQAKRVIGFEAVSSAIKDAYENCRNNKIDNCEFIHGDIRWNLSKIDVRPDVMVCDPPRSGMHPDVIEMIIKIRPPKVVYISCNPTTMSRDLKSLIEYYYLKEIQPVDMFPHTYHIESVVKLELT